MTGRKIEIKPHEEINDTIEDKILSKRLLNKVVTLRLKLIAINSNDLQFAGQDPETKKALRKAIDELKYFIDNIK